MAMTDVLKELSAGVRGVFADRQLCKQIVKLRGEYATCPPGSERRTDLGAQIADLMLTLADHIDSAPSFAAYDTAQFRAEAELWRTGAMSAG